MLMYLVKYLEAEAVGQFDHADTLEEIYAKVQKSIRVELVEID